VLEGGVWPAERMLNTVSTMPLATRPPPQRISNPPPYCSSVARLTASKAVAALFSSWLEASGVSTLPLSEAEQ
jgi:hypothetical protein